MCVYKFIYDGCQTNKSNKHIFIVVMSTIIHLCLTFLICLLFGLNCIIWTNIYVCLPNGCNKFRAHSFILSFCMVYHIIHEFLNSVPFIYWKWEAQTCCTNDVYKDIVYPVRSKRTHLSSTDPGLNRFR